MPPRITNGRISIEEADKICATYGYTYMYDPKTIKPFISKERFIELLFENEWASRCYQGIRRGDRFLRKIQFTDTCWLWVGPFSEYGYGRVTIEYKTLNSHRVAYKVAYGDIQPGMHLDHVVARGCNNRNCLNPNHLEEVTVKINTLRAFEKCVNKKKTHCKNGHEFTPSNTYRFYNPTSNSYGRECRTCRLVRNHKYCRKKPNDHHQNTQDHLSTSQIGIQVGM